MKYFKEKNIKFERVPWYQEPLIIKNANEKAIQKLEYIRKRIYIFTKPIKHGATNSFKS